MLGSYAFIVIFSSAKASRDFSFSPHIRNLPIEKGFHGLGVDFPKTGVQERKGKGRDGIDNRYRLTHKGQQSKAHSHSEDLQRIARRLADMPI